MDNLVEQIAGVITTLREDNGFDFPIYLVGIARNGVMFAATYAINFDGDVSCEFTLSPNQPLATPINIMLTDDRAEAARIVLGPQTRLDDDCDVGNVSKLFR